MAVYRKWCVIYHCVDVYHLIAESKKSSSLGRFNIVATTGPCKHSPMSLYSQVSKMVNGILDQTTQSNNSTDQLTTSNGYSTVWHWSCSKCLVLPVVKSPVVIYLSLAGHHCPLWPCSYPCASPSSLCLAQATHCPSPLCTDASLTQAFTASLPACLSHLRDLLKINNSL